MQLVQVHMYSAVSQCKPFKYGQVFGLDDCDSGALDATRSFIMSRCTSWTFIAGACGHQHWCP